MNKPCLQLNETPFVRKGILEKDDILGSTEHRFALN